MGLIFDQAWADVLFIAAIVLVGLYIILLILRLNAKSTYNRWLNNPSTPLDVDSFVNVAKNPPGYLKISFLQKMSVGDRKPSDVTVKLASAESTHVPGLQVTERAEKRPNSNLDPTPTATPLVINTSGASKSPAPLVIGTIRMGFGHHRIAYAACAWAMHVDEDNNTAPSKDNAARTTYFHDLLNIDSEQADLIKSTDAVYSKMSRITSNIGGVVEKLWGKAMLQGDADALRISGLTAVHLRPLFKDLPYDTPIIATHCYVALAAVSAGFKNVINLVIDNHAQWFVVVPGCLNLVQGPVNYQNFLKMGVDPANIQIAGHWIPRDLVMNIPSDCELRIQRAKSGFKTGAFKPRRILIPVGGAGAQRKFIVQFVRALKPLILEQKVQLFLNAGDHEHMKAAFQSVLSEIGLDGQYDTVDSTAGVHAFRDNLLKGKEPNTQVTLFSFSDYFPAVATTDILSRVADVLACKPSELAFYPVPKLMIRRVGDHEQFSALRAGELGDGTLEARELEDCLTYMNLFVNGFELLEQMNTSIVSNNTQGVYDGCKNAVKIALERAATMK